MTPPFYRQFCYKAFRTPQIDQLILFQFILIAYEMIKALLLYLFLGQPGTVLDEYRFAVIFNFVSETHKVNIDEDLWFSNNGEK